MGNDAIRDVFCEAARRSASYGSTASSFGKEDSYFANRHMCLTRLNRKRC
jgi:hypothetical protein